ncbi:hypothetical protein FA13DRAFT_1526371 [Coprinellus micaceus]|uniref:Uncharacterized protein n=1 Tax=Coprinellus micaceus TaxID=71717 RepID=A0A4Y7SJY4_COPMI|nr:hypothetical protein FA13DRAFT_1526371 [Coprinellus micaceus]
MPRGALMPHWGGSNQSLAFKESFEECTSVTPNLDSMARRSWSLWTVIPHYTAVPQGLSHWDPLGLEFDVTRVSKAPESSLTRFHCHHPARCRDPPQISRLRTRQSP